jgi:hypothetical protein
VKILSEEIGQVNCIGAVKAAKRCFDCAIALTWIGLIVLGTEEQGDPVPLERHAKRASGLTTRVTCYGTHPDRLNLFKSD